MRKLFISRMLYTDMNTHTCQNGRSLSYSRTEDTLRNHRSWFLYTAARDLDRPFRLEELQECIYEKVGVRPQRRRLLVEARRFYEEHDIALINRVEPASELFTANEVIDLDKPEYRSIIRPPGEFRGRPRKRAPYPGPPETLTGRD